MRYTVNGAGVDYPDLATQEFIISQIALSERVPVEYIIIEQFDDKKREINYINIMELLSKANSVEDAQDVMDTYRSHDMFVTWATEDWAMRYQYAKSAWLNKPLSIALRAQQTRWGGSRFTDVSYDTFARNFGVAMQQLQSKVESERKQMKTLKLVEVGDYEPDQVSITIKTKTTKPLFKLFDDFQPNDLFPFAFAQGASGSEIKSFYKIYSQSEFKPSSIGDITAERNVIELRMTDRKVHTTTYEPVKWNLSSGELILNITPKSVKINVAIETFKNAFGLTDSEIISGDLSSTRGHFIIPNRNIEATVLLDLIGTDPVFSSYFYVDEILKTSSSKSHFYVFYQPPNAVDKVALTFNVREANEGDYGMKKATIYMDVRVSGASSDRNVNDLRENLKRLLGIYDIHATRIKEIYSRLVPEEEMKEFKATGRIKASAQSKNSLLKKYAPEVFMANYSRVVCQTAKKQPSIIPPMLDREEFERKIRETSAQEIGSHWIYCDDPKFKHLHFRNNPLPNAKRFPELPCCNSSEENRAQGKTTQSTYVAAMDKALGVGKVGKIPDDIEAFLIKHSLVQNMNWLRIGLADSDNFLHSVAYCIDEKYNKKKVGGSNEVVVENLRNSLREMVAEERAPIHQEMYDVGMSTALTMLRPGGIDVDPYRFIRLVETFYGINIIMFEKNLDTDKYQIAIPHHALAYYAPSFDPEASTIFLIVYKTKDGLSVEPIYAKAESKIMASFPPSEEIHELLTLRDYSYTVYETPREDDLLYMVDNPDAQLIDSFGKRRGLYYGDVLVYHPPTYSLGIPVKSTTQVVRASKLKKSFVFSGVVPDRGVMTQAGFIECLLDMPQLNGLPKVELPDYYYDISDAQEKVFQDHINKKVASFLLQQTLYAYSQLQRFGITDASYVMTVDESIPNYTLKDFGQEIFSASKTAHKGDIVSYRDQTYIVTLATKNNVNLRGLDRVEVARVPKTDIRVVKRMKIICQSERLRDNLLNQLEIYNLTFPNVVNNYYHQSQFIDYYQYVTDFKVRPATQIFETRDDMMVFFRNQNINQLFEESEANLIAPYYVHTKQGINLVPLTGGVGGRTVAIATEADEE